MLWCMIVGHVLVPLRFQPSKDPDTWLYQCRRCGKAQTT
jgi:hypothetical protein